MLYELCLFNQYEVGIVCVCVSLLSDVCILNAQKQSETFTVVYEFHLAELVGGRATEQRFVVGISVCTFRVGSANYC